jgi:hypothetical protein
LKKSNEGIDKFLFIKPKLEKQMVLGFLTAIKLGIAVWDIIEEY